jgi:hypothetical protein
MRVLVSATSVLVIALGCGRTELLTSDDAGGTSDVSNPPNDSDYKVAFVTQLVPPSDAGFNWRLGVWHSRDGSLETFGDPGQYLGVPAFTFDGKWLVAQETQWAIALLDPLGGIRPQDLSQVPQGVLFAYPRPDGNRLAILSRGAGGTSVVGTVDPDGTYRRLFDTFDASDSPVYAPDGHTLAAIEGGLNGQRIILIQDDGTNRVEVTREDDYPEPRCPCFSFDGAKLAFQSGGDILIFDRATNVTTRVAGPVGLNANLQFTPDGHALILSAQKWHTGANDLQRIDITTGEVTTLLPNILGGYLSVQPVAVAIDE